MAKIKTPDISRLFTGKNFLLDVGIVILGFTVIGLASTAGTIAMKYIYNNYLLPDIPNAEKVPY